MVEIKRILYQYVFKRTSTFCLAMVCSAMFFERYYDHVCEYIFEKANEGKLWMHIKHKYEEKPDEVKNLASMTKVSVEELSHGHSDVEKVLDWKATRQNNRKEESKTR